MSPIYSLKIANAPNKSEIRSNRIPTRVPKPSNGTPLVIQLNVWNTKTVIEMMDVMRERNIDNFKGLFENEKIPLKANASTLKVVAFDIPEYLSLLEKSKPIDLNPTHEKNPL